MDNVKKTVLEFLKILQKYNGYASTKGNIVLNHLGITTKDIPLICDTNPFKYNYSGTNIKIVSRNNEKRNLNIF